LLKSEGACIRKRLTRLPPEVPESISTSHSMKIISIILIIAYLMLPAICFGHPCAALATNPSQSALASDACDQCPLNPDNDYCETTCCCAGHVPQSTAIRTPYADLTAKQMPYDPRLALPRLIDRIFVPPQNPSGIS
jgi:hypothetical protein